MQRFLPMSVISLFIMTFLSQAYGIEPCEQQNLYNLFQPPYCRLQYMKGGERIADTKEIMFEITKAYPYEKKDEFAKLLERRITLLDSSVTQLRAVKQTAIIKREIVEREKAEFILAEQLRRVNAANKENWEKARDDARGAIESLK